MLSRRARIGLLLLAFLHFSVLFGCALARYHNVHQRTFDLALYARIAWGFAHLDLWSPVLNSHALGAHVAPVLLPLGLLGALLGVVPVLLAAQALALSLTVFPLARIAARRVGTPGIYTAACAAVLYPNFFHVGSYEFHPGTLAVLPMLWAYDALDRARMRELALSLLGVLACREDLAAFAALIAAVYWIQHRDRRALTLLGGVLGYGALATALTLHYAPAHGSLDEHFGVWGGSPLGVFATAWSDPARFFAHFGARERLLYLPRVLAPLSFFSLRAPLLLLPGLPYLALNLLSAFPTADEQYSHYLTPAVPALLVSGVVGFTAVRTRFLRKLWYATLGLAHVALGGSPLSRDFDRAAFAPDSATRAARHVLARIAEDASVQAPDALLPHLSERHELRRAPPPEARTRYVVVDISHRARYAREEVLLRTTEEPWIRKLLARPDHALLVYHPPYALFERGRDAREGALSQCLVTSPPPSKLPGLALSACLELESAVIRDGVLELVTLAKGGCPADLALRFGPDPLPGRVELLCEGKISPALLRSGERVRSLFSLSSPGLREVRERGLWVGALRANGNPPEASAPVAIPVQVQWSNP